MFLGFTVTKVSEDSVTFASNWARYIVNNGDTAKEFTVHKGENLHLNMVDILDAVDLTTVELLEVTTPDK